MANPVRLVGSGKKATLITGTNTSVSPDQGKATAPINNVLRVTEQLPILLAGPVVRRLDLDRVTIWAATSVAANIRCKLTRMSSGAEIASKAAQQIALGDQLFIHLVTIEAGGGVTNAPLPRGELIGYDFEVAIPSQPGVLDIDGDILLTQDEITIGGLTLPTFFVPMSGGSAPLVHASCRKFHAPGQDAIQFLDQRLRDTAKDLSKRPSALLLTGDQIYADDVHSGLTNGILELGRALLGFDEIISVPDPKTKSFVDKKVFDFGSDQRGFVRQVGFTVDQKVSENHLLGFGDYAAMYILAWNPEIWKWDKLRDQLSFQGLAAQFASPAMRRVLANVPVYMILDDHEVTDDWNLTAKWKRETSNPTARRIIANGLGAYWAFQAIGNDPSSGRDAPVKSAVPTYLLGQGKTPGPFESTMHGFHEWRFVSPTQPRVIFLDTRTQRVLPPRTRGFEEPPGLLDDDSFNKLTAAIKDIPGDPEKDPVVIVSPGPFIGYEKVEELQKISAHVGLVTQEMDPEADPEAWSFNPDAFVRFLRTMLGSGRKRFVILSGDVHYAYTAIASCTQRTGGQTQTIQFAQLTSSAIKNQPGGIQGALLAKVGSTDDKTYFFIGHASGNRFFWQSEDFLKDNKLQFPTNWDLQLRFRYVKAGPAHLVTNNNVGLIGFTASTLEHTLLSQDGPRSAVFSWDDIPKQIGTPLAAFQ